MSIRVIIVEDHELFREGLRLLVQEAYSDVQIFEAHDFPTAKNLLSKQTDITLMLFDIHLPGTTGLAGIREIKNSYPTIPLVVVSTVDSQASVKKLLSLGIDGFIGKTSSKATIIRALREIMDGEKVIVGTQEHFQPSVDLSPRLIVTLELLAKGLSNKEIAKQLNISPATVREYVSNLLDLFGSSNRTQLVLKARQQGFLID